MTTNNPVEDATYKNGYAAELEKVRQRTGVDLGPTGSTRMEQVGVLERRELEAKFPGTTKSLNALNIEPYAPPIATFVGFLIFGVGFTVWLWSRFKNSGHRGAKSKNTLSQALSSRDARAAVVIAMLWIICISLWGYIWRWESHFTGNQFSTLILAGPVIIFFGWAGTRWIGASKKKAH